MNVFIGSGRLANDPEMRMTNNGIPVTTFCIAIEPTFKKSDDQKPDYFNCVAWRKTAENINRFFKKGKKILIQGEMKNRSFTTKNGENRRVDEVVVASFTFMDSNVDSGTRKATQEDIHEMLENMPDTIPEYPEIDEEDSGLPF